MTSAEFLEALAVPRAVEAALQQGLLSDEAPAVLFHELSSFDARCADLRSVFPTGALHALAIKANPVRRLLERAVRAGLGLEAASLEEVELAVAAGCPPDRIVFDSPAKTRAELKRALDLGVLIHVDNWEELARIAKLDPAASSSEIGLRVNTLVGAGRIAATSVAAHGSKFGVRWDEWEPMVAAFARYPWLTALHAHVGSQGGALAPLVTSAARLVDLADRIDAQLGQARVRSLDIGGGLSVQYRDDERPPSVRELAAALRAGVPALFEGSRRVVTELGRSLLAPDGFAISRVEYVKDRTAVLHLGADLLLRPVYAPRDWHHRAIVLTPDGKPRAPEAERSKFRLVGPLCFGGDVLGEYEFPTVREGDWVVLRDVGAYTLSMWSRHCSRAMPGVLGYERARPEALEVLRRRETPSDVVRFWGPS